MKKNLPTYLIALFLIFNFTTQIKAGGGPVVLREWAAVAGNSDSVFTIPILTDNSYTYIATSHFDSLTGPDIMIIKYDKEKKVEWTHTWSGTGVNRDQPSDMVMDNDFLYLSGTTFSPTNNYDYLVMQINKSDGSFVWVKTYNGPSSNYDVATALIEKGNYLYVTGISFSTSTMGDYHTIKYKKDAGSFEWAVDFDYDQKMEIPFDIVSDTIKNQIVVTGASQSSSYDWDYETIAYDSLGNLEDDSRVSGSAAGFDRALVVKNDASGNLYISGSTYTSSDGDDMKTVKVNSNGTPAWIRTYANGQNDIAYDLVVDQDKNVYVCGESYGTGQDFLIIKYDSIGTTKWTKRVDGSGYDDVAYKLCLDHQKNLIVTGKGYNPQKESYDFLTVALTIDGDELWRDYYDGKDHGADEARNVVVDSANNIFVSGLVEVNGAHRTVTIKYRTDFFISPPAVDSPAVAYLFYPNEGQLIDYNDSLVTDSVHYYTLHHNPQLYFGYGVMNMVFAHIDQDTTTTDTLQRVDVSFLNSTKVTHAFPVDQAEEAGYLNYYLSHCPDGINFINGNRKLLYTDVYEGIDAEYGSNSADIKLFFIVNPNSSNPQEIGLKFEGQTSVSVINNWQLRVTTALGTYEFEKPKVYQLDTNNNKISLPWYLSWNIQNGNEANFTGWGSYDGDKPLIVEISRSVAAPLTGLPKWCAFIGSPLADGAYAVTSDIVGNSYTLGNSLGENFVTAPGQINLPGNSHGQQDFFVLKADVDGYLQWWTLLGGSQNDFGTDITYDKEGANERLFVVGSTNSHDSFIFQPTTNSSCYQEEVNQGGQAFISEFDAELGTTIWSTTVAGPESYFSACTVDNNHNVIAVGSDYAKEQSGSAMSCVPQTNSSGANAALTMCNPGNGAYFQPIPGRDDVVFGSPIQYPEFNYDGIIMRFDAEGVLNYSTYFGGEKDEHINDVDVDLNDNIWIVGSTKSAINCPSYFCSSGVISGCEGAFTLCNSTGNVNTYFNYVMNIFGGLEQDAFLVKLDPNLVLKLSTYFGGRYVDNGSSIVCNSTGDVYIAGYTNNIASNGLCNAPSTNYGLPICYSGGEYTQSSGGGSSSLVTDNFISRFSNDGELKWSTLWGAYGSEGGDPQLAVDLNDNVYLVGSTKSPEASGQNALLTVDRPSVGFNCQQSVDVQYNLYNTPEGYITCFSKFNYPLWSTYFGGRGDDECTGVSASDAGYLYVCGLTYAQSFFPINMPLTNQCCNNINWGDREAFISQFDISNIIDIPEINKPKLNLKIFPNPTQNQLTVDFVSPKTDKVEMKCIDVMGQEVYLKKLQANVGSNSIQISTIDFASGIYVIQLSSGISMESIKFVKQ